MTEHGYASYDRNADGRHVVVCKCGHPLKRRTRELAIGALLAHISKSNELSQRRRNPMDPIECLRLLLDNLVSASDMTNTEVNRSNCKRRAAEHARGLADWLERDGFAPNIARTLAGVSPGGYGYVVGGAS